MITGVFEDGAVTITVANDGTIRVFVGTTALSIVRSIKMTGGLDEQPQIEIVFPARTGKEDLDLRVEEMMRLASTVKCAVVKRADP